MSFPFNLPNFIQFWHCYPDGPYWHPPLILCCDFLRPCYYRNACAVYSASVKKKMKQDYFNVQKLPVTKRILVFCDQCFSDNQKVVESSSSLVRNPPVLSIFRIYKGHVAIKLQAILFLAISYSSPPFSLQHHHHRTHSLLGFYFLFFLFWSGTTVSG